ncbi:chloride channel protein [Actinomyces ruminis]|uniref:chloride channel protein n=1 Tax=Actinomyces ruminis TaxID=1937003 RepID=UPI0030B80E64
MTTAPAATPPGSPARAGVRLLAAALVSGVAAGLIGIAMALLLEGFEWLFYGVGAGTLPQRVQTAATWRRIAAPAAGGLTAGALWWWERTTGGVVSVEAAVGDVSGRAGRRMGMLRPFADGVLQVLTVGAGNSVGREGAPRLMAGAVAARAASRLELDPKTTRTLVAAAAGAGLAAMYNAPLGGAAFAVEITMLAGMRRRGVWLALPVSLLATVVSWLHSGGRPTFTVSIDEPNAATLVAALPVAVVAALLGVGARALWAWVRAHRLPDTWHCPSA